jgi:hypothetical protein
LVGCLDGKRDVWKAGSSDEKKGKHLVVMTVGSLG